MNMQQDGYLPVDLGKAFTDPVSILEDPDEVTLGDRELHGIPFRFGNPEAALVAARPGSRHGFKVDQRATWIVFAHAVLETDLYSGGAVGTQVGAYTVHYADEMTHEIPLRQRMEIGPTPRKWSGQVIPLDWGQTPFLAVNGAKHRLMNRQRGRYDEAGAWLVGIEDPQSSVPYVLPYRFYLWGWRNRRPDVPVRSIEVCGGDRHTILLGAVTRSVLDEEPLNRDVMREVLIRLDGENISEDLEVDVNRGFASYVFQANRSEAEPGIGVVGWGVDLSDPGSGYVRIAAAPSATVTVRQQGRLLGTFAWGELVSAGSLQVTDSLQVELPAADRTWVRGEVRDAETGQPVACRIRFESADGIPFVPHGHHAHINADGSTWNLDIGGDLRLGASTYAFIDGRFEGWLPNGKVTVEIVRGFTYEPIRSELEVSPQTPDFVFDLKRAFRPLARGYAGGDTHVHFVSTKGAELEGRAEDLQVVNLLQSQWGQLFTNTEEFSGRPEPSADGQTVVYTGQENRTNMLGHINLLGLRRPIMPWCTGGSEEAELGGGLETTLSYWADECHAQQGLVILAHFPVPYGEAPALVATGRADALETIGFDHYNINEYYRYLDAGFQVPLVAGTDKMTSEVPIGLMRTYAKSDPAGTIDYGAWVQGIREGNTTVSSGPLLWATIHGTEPGGTVRIAQGDTPKLRVELETIFPVNEIEVIVNGELAARLTVPESASAHTVEHRLDPLDRDSWVVVRCFGGASGRHHDTWNRPVFAHTSPIYLTTGDEYARRDRDALEIMLRTTEGARQHVFERSRTIWAGRVSHRHGGDDHIGFLLAPFDEAIAALEKRLSCIEST